MTNNVTHDAISYVDMVSDCLPTAALLEVLLISVSFLRIWIFMNYPKFGSYLQSREIQPFLPNQKILS